MVTYASAPPVGANTASPARLVPERLKLWRTVPAEAMRIALVAVDGEAKHTVSVPGPTLLSGQEGSAVSVVTVPDAGLGVAEYADCICMSKDPQPHPPDGTRANAIPEAFQAIR